MTAKTKRAEEVMVSTSLPLPLFRRLETERRELHREAPDQKFSRSTLIRHFLSVGLDWADLERHAEREATPPPRTRRRAAP